MSETIRRMGATARALTGLAPAVLVAGLVAAPASRAEPLAWPELALPKPPLPKPPLPEIALSPPVETPNSILIFGGRMSSTNIGSTALFNLALYGTRQTGQRWDNSIFGLAYDRDLIGLGHGLFLGAEIGAADRVGPYAECCQPIVTSQGVLNSFEFWSGLQFRAAGVLLFDLVRVGGAVTFGLSAVTDSIGRERNRELTTGADPALLYYFGPEIDFSTPSLPHIELFVRLQHRSGGAALGILPALGHMQEGYNADVVGLRYRF
ncbi:MAG TPA: hypothetical protein VMU18_01475 [Rhodoblastus sp.]|nr:hypothetical protein [Rhodoblastus sp.]